MHCDEARERVSRSVDGELASHEADALEQHLAGCEACRVYRRQVLAMAELMRPGPAPTLPEGYGEALRASLRRKLAPVIAGRRVNWRAWLRLAAAAAIAAVALAALALALEVHELRREMAQRDRQPGPTPVAAVPVLDDAPKSLLSPCLGEQAQAFRAVQEDVGGRLRWMAVDGRQADIGTSGPADPRLVTHPLDQAAGFAFRFVEADPHGPDRTVSNPCITVYAGAEARVWFKPTNGQGKGRFLYQVKSEPQTNGGVAGRITFSWHAEDDPADSTETTVLLQTSHIFQDTAPVLLGRWLHNGRSYELWGAATVLKPRTSTQRGAT